MPGDGPRPGPSLPEPLLGRLSAVDATWGSLLEQWVGLACDPSGPIPGTHGKCWDAADGGACGWTWGQVIECCEPTEFSSFPRVPERPGSPGRRARNGCQGQVPSVIGTLGPSGGGKEGMRVDGAELSPGGNSALKLTERGKAPMVSPHLAPKTQSPGLSRQSLPLGTTPLSNHPSIHPFIYSTAISRTLATCARL